MRRPRLSELEFTLRFEFPVIEDLSKPNVTLHKNGKYLLIKPNDPISADTLRELSARLECSWMGNPLYFNSEGGAIRDWRKIELWKHLRGNIGDHPLCGLLKTYGVEVGTAPSLEGYIRKEGRRRQLESMPHPAPPVTNDDDVSLFDRCVPGTSLLCIKDCTPPGTHITFEVGKRYLVTGGSNGDDLDQIQICIDPIKKGATLNIVAQGRLHNWTDMDAPMEEWFDDSENVDFGETVDQKYPERVRQMEDRLSKLDFVRKALDAGQKHPLYKHVRLDAVLEALSRGVVNCKLMRMGKSSESITICELWQSKKVAIIGSKNVRLAYRKEFRRLGLENFVFVNRFSDLDKEGKYYLMTYDWLKQVDDPTAVPRDKYENYLKEPERTYRRKVEWDKDPQSTLVFQNNLCPHCNEAMERPLLAEEGITVKAQWTNDRGYICRNAACHWETDNTVRPFRHGLVKGGRSHAGAAWASDRVVKHKPGTYVDMDLALHARCSETKVRTRMCPECKVTDGTWTPPRYKRVKDRFSAVVADEVHNAKDIKTQNAQALYAFRSRRRIAQTGTLLSNSPIDAYWPLNWAINMPSESFPWRYKDGAKEFEQRFCQFAYLEKPTGEIDEETGVEITETIRKRTPFLLNPPDWWRTMQKVIYRRTYNDPDYQESLLEAGMKMPNLSKPHGIKKATVPMKREQVEVMLEALRDFRKEYEEIVAEAEAAGREINKARVISKMSALRTIATSPERINRRFGREVYTGQPGGGKMDLVKSLVAQAVGQGKKVFIISDFIEMQCLLERELKQYNPIRLIPSWGDERRTEAMEMFADDPKRKVFIAGTRAVRESIDVSAADVTICMDLLWSPAWQAQAWSRTMAPTPRDRDCDVYLMVSQHSLDEYIYEVFYGKMAGAEQALDRKIMSRRALDFNVKVFAELVLSEERALSLQLRDEFGDEKVIYMPDRVLMEERVA